MTKSRVLWIGALLLSIAVVLVGIFCYRDHVLDQLRDEMLLKLDERAGDYDERSVVLQNTTRREAEDLAEQLSAELRISENGKFAVLTLPEDVTVRNVFSARENRKYLEEMSIDYKVQLFAASDEKSEHFAARPNYTITDSHYKKQTYLDYLNLSNVWSTTKGKGAKVAIIDTGIDTDHPEFSERISEYSYNATEDKIVKDYILEDGAYDWSLTEDENGHGTAVAGVISASMNSERVVGIAPQAELIVIKAECDANGNFVRSSDLVFGLYYAIERGASVVNMSFGLAEEENPFAEAIKLAVDSDVICVAAAGNEATATPSWPAADEHVFGVGALESDGWGACLVFQLRR